MSTLYESYNDSFSQAPLKLYPMDLSGKQIWAPLHWHRSIELLIPFEGQMGVNVGSDNFDFTKDDWVIINSSELHSSRYLNLGDHFQGIAILISMSFIESWLGKERFFVNPHIPAVTDQIKAIAKQLYHECTSLRKGQEQNPLYQLFLLEQACRVVHIMGEFCVQDGTTYKIPFHKEQGKTSEFLHYIEQNYRENLTLNDIALHFQYSPGYFSRFFKEAVGVNYYAYLNYVRVNHAAEELLEKHTTLTECALNHGFPNTKSFINMFKRQFGCTPGKFLNS